ncbi:MAG: type 1 glutamine amidotransferase [Lentimonas sp.]|jgi:type 1 glutamine amidotransferase
MMRFPFFLSIFLFAHAVFADSNWAPSFDDKALTQAQINEVNESTLTSPIVAPSSPRRVLIFSATAGYRHQSIPIGKYALEQLGLSTGAYETVISDDPINFEKESLGTFDAVILLNTSKDFFMPSRKERKNFPGKEWRWLEARQNRLVDNLTEYVREGGGLVGIHAASDACYQHEEFGNMIGGYFDGHPWRASFNVTLVAEDPSHAINQPVFLDTSTIQIKEEIYQFRDEPYSRDKLRVLMHLDPERSDPAEGMKRADNDYAVAWVQSVGEGRVFYTSLGHNNHIFTHPQLLKHFLAGIQFATGDLEADTTPSAKLKP